MPKHFLLLAIVALTIVAAENNNNYTSPKDIQTSMKLSQVFKKIDVNGAYIYEDLKDCFNYLASRQPVVPEVIPSELLKSFAEKYDSHVELTYKNAPFYLNRVQKHFNSFDKSYKESRKTKDTKQSWMEFNETFKVVYFNALEEFKEVIQRVHSPLQEK